MNRKYWLVPVAVLCLATAAGCTRDDAKHAQDDEPPAEWQLERIQAVADRNIRRYGLV